MEQLPIQLQRYLKESNITEEEFTSQEKIVLNKIISEIQKTGSSNLLDSLYMEDYEEIPISFNQFIDDPFYLGSATDNGTAVWPTWRKEMNYIFDPLNQIYLSMFSGPIGVGKSTVACWGIDYMLYKLLCLKDPARFHNLAPDERIGVGLFNITLSKGYGVAFEKINTALKKSPWFLKHGEIIGSSDRTSIFYPEKGVTIGVGSSAEHFIGLNTYCLSGDTKILTEYGIKTLYELSQYRYPFRVVTVTKRNTIAYSDYTACQETDNVNELYTLTFEDGSTLKCTGNHKFLKSDINKYKMVKRLSPGDCINTLSGAIKIISIQKNLFENKIPVYDIIDAYPYNNFIIDTGSSYVISHNCISGKTEIATVDGWKTINEIKDTQTPIYNVNKELGTINLSDPCQIHETKIVTQLCQVELENGVIIETTPDHKFLTTKGDYIEAQYLKDEDLMEVQCFNDECEPVGYIYETFCDVNNKKYIGKKHSKLFVKSYVGSGKLLIKDVKKYGKEHFHTRVIKWCYSLEDLCESEYYYIKFYNAHESDDYYNLTIGGESFLHTPETRLKMSKSAKDRIKKYGANTAGLIWVHKDGVGKRINPNELENYLIKGYTKGAPSGRRGLVTIHYGTQIKKVRREDLELYLSQGWLIGSGVKNNKNKVHIYKDNQDKMVNIDELDAYINNGWIKGRRPTNADTMWVNKDDKRLMISKDLVNNYLEQGYKIGSNIHANKGTIYIHNLTKCKRVTVDDFENIYKPLGYNRGRKVWMSRNGIETFVPFGKISQYLSNGWERVGLKHYES